MQVSKSSSTPFVPAPKGTYQAVCVDIIDEGMHPNTFQDNRLEHKLSIVFQLNKRDENGKLYTISRWFTLSLHERSSLAGFLCEWHDASYAELPKDFELEELVGRNARIRVAQEPKKTKPDELKSIIKSIEGWDGDDLMVPEDYERIYKREPKTDDDYQAAETSSPPANKFRPSSSGQSVPAHVDPRSVNTSPAQAQRAVKAKAIAAVLPNGEEADDEDPFADE